MRKNRDALDRFENESERGFVLFLMLKINACVIRKESREEKMWCSLEHLDFLFLYLPYLVDAFKELVGSFKVKTLVYFIRQ